jgi:predicted transcriptional regulator
MANYISIMNERKPFTTSLNIDLLKTVKKLAIDQDRSVNEIIEEALRDFLKKQEKKREK